RRNLANGLIVLVGNVQVLRTVNGNSTGGRKSRGAAGAIGAPGDPGGASQRCHYPGRRDFADRSVGVIGDIDVAGAIRSNAKPVTETRVTANPIDIVVVSGESRQRSYFSCRRNLTHSIVVGIGNIHVASAVDCHSKRVKELRCAACAVGAPDHSGRSSQRCHYPGGGNFPDGTVGVIGYVKVAGFIGGNTKGQVELRATAGAI